MMPCTAVSASADEIKQEPISVEKIIENTVFITFRQAPEDEEYGRNIFVCHYLPNEMYNSNYTYGVLIFPKNYAERYDLKSDYLNKVEEKGITILNLKIKTWHETKDGKLARTGLSRIMDQNVNREFTFIFYVQSDIGETAYARPRFAMYSTLNADDYTYQELEEMAKEKVRMESSFRRIVQRLCELVDSFWIYIVLAMAAVVVVWGAYIGMRIAIAKRKEEQINAREMVKNLLIGLLIMAIIGSSVPLLLMGMDSWFIWA